MVENISSKVKTFERRLPSCNNTSESSIQLPASPDNKPIRVVFTFGSDEASIEIVDKFEFKYWKIRLVCHPVRQRTQLAIIHQQTSCLVMLNALALLCATHNYVQKAVLLPRLNHFITETVNVAARLVKMTRTLSMG